MGLEAMAESVRASAHSDECGQKIPDCRNYDAETVGNNLY